VIVDDVSPRSLSQASEQVRSTRKRSALKKNQTEAALPQVSQTKRNLLNRDESGAEMFKPEGADGPQGSLMALPIKRTTTVNVQQAVSTIMQNEVQGKKTTGQLEGNLSQLEGNTAGSACHSQVAENKISRQLQFVINSTINDPVMRDLVDRELSDILKMANLSSRAPAKAEEVQKDASEQEEGEEAKEAVDETPEDVFERADLKLALATSTINKLSMRNRETMQQLLEEMDRVRVLEEAMAQMEVYIEDQDS